VRERHRKSVPVIVEPQDDKAPTIDKCKFLVPHDLTYGQFLYVIRKRIQLPPEQSLFMFCNNILPIHCTTIRELHRNYGSEDGFVYFQYALENTFGV
jgi:GABA(A) receptor-associated protein